MSEPNAPAVTPETPDKRISVSKAHWDAMKEALLYCYGYVQLLEPTDRQKQALENIAAARECRRLPHEWESWICERWHNDHGLLEALRGLINERIEEAVHDHYDSDHRDMD